MQNVKPPRVPSAAYLAVQKFFSENSKATTLLLAAAHDYASARCLLLNWLVSGGLVAGAEAIEKFLNAYILLKCPTKDIRKLQHSLRALLNDADQLSPDLMLSKYSVLMGRYEDYYRNRYPDNRVAFSRDEFCRNTRAGRIHYLHK